MLKKIILILKMKLYSLPHVYVAVYTHYKKMYYCGEPKPPQKPKNPAAKGPLDLQLRVLLRWFFLSLLRCQYRSIAVGIKSTAIDLPFSRTFGLFWRAKNCSHIRLPFESSDLLVAGNKRRYRASCTTTFQRQFRSPLYICSFSGGR